MSAYWGQFTYTTQLMTPNYLVAWLVIRDFLPHLEPKKCIKKKKITKDQCTCTGRKGNLIHAEWYSIIIIIIIVVIFINYHYYYYYYKFVSLMRWLQICNRLHVARWKGVVCTLSSSSQHFFILVIVST